MSVQNWEKVEVMQEPLRVIFYYQCGNMKAATVEELYQAEWDNVALAEGRNLPNGREPFFNREETVAAKQAIKEQGFQLA